MRKKLNVDRISKNFPPTLQWIVHCGLSFENTPDIVEDMSGNML